MDVRSFGVPQDDVRGLLVTGRHLLVIGHWSLIRHWDLDIGHSLSRGSSVVERPALDRLDAGSSPAPEFVYGVKK